jgi:hypothetical protein
MIGNRCFLKRGVIAKIEALALALFLRSAKMLDAGYWILDAGCWMLDAGCWMQKNK